MSKKRKVNDTTSPESGFSADSVRIVAEICGIPALPAACCTLISDDVTFRMKQVLQEARKVAQRRKVPRLGVAEVEQALLQLGEEPIYGATYSQQLPLKYVTGGGKDVFFHDDVELDLNAVSMADTPKVPMEVTCKAHWLALEGRQPSVPENPPAERVEEQRRKTLNPSAALVEPIVRPKSLWELTAAKARTQGGAKATLKAPEQAKFKDISTHEISVEQQYYYKELTEACVGSNEEKRSEALRSLQTDSGLHQLLPHLITFICEGIRVNVLNNNLALLIYLMRMIKFLMDNTYIYLEKYLHMLIPNTLTCAVSRTLCARPETDNHWALRDFAAKQLAALCTKFNSPTVEIQARVCQVITSQIERSSSALTSIYGCLAIACELGPETIRSVLIPLLPGLARRLQPLLEHVVPTINVQEHREAEKIRNYLVTQLAPLLRGKYITLEELRKDAGWLAADLWREMSRQQRAGTGFPVSSSGGSAGHHPLRMQRALMTPASVSTASTIVTPKLESS